nr:hypothetical protein [Tanacetum cinerariifolium]
MFGIGQKVSLDMFEESAGLMPSKEWKRITRRQAWFPGETVILGIGQGYMQVNNGMQAVMHDPRGIARAAAQGAQYRIAGKSGTAQVVAIKQGERYNRDKTLERHRDNALFVGFAPAANPKIAVAQDGHLKQQYATPAAAPVNPKCAPAESVGSQLADGGGVSDTSVLKT